jgi:hypothetical protein
VPNDGSEYQEGLLRDGLIDRRFWIAIPDHMSYFTSDSTASSWSLASDGDRTSLFFRISGECMNLTTTTE